MLQCSFRGSFNLRNHTFVNILEWMRKGDANIPKFIFTSYFRKGDANIP